MLDRFTIEIIYNLYYFRYLDSNVPQYLLFWKDESEVAKDFKFNSKKHQRLHHVTTSDHSPYHLSSENGVQPFNYPKNSKPFSSWCRHKSSIIGIPLSS